MKRAVAAFLMIGLAGVGCTSVDVWQRPGTVTPVSYDFPSEGLGRTVGKLRRLVLLEGRFTMTKEGKPDVEGLQNLRRNVVAFARTFLQNQRGYEVEIWRQPTDEIADCRARLAKWASSADEHKALPDYARSCLTEIPRSASFDGVVVVNGSHKWDFEVRYLLTLLTASMAWPTLMSQYRIYIEAVLYEASSGEITWRSKLEKSAAEDIGTETAVGLALEPLEHALPAVLVDSPS